jgi:hypothetical protein
MKKLFILISFSFLISTSYNSAQSKFQFSFSAGYIGTPLNSYRLPYWTDGYMGNFSAYYKVRENISLYLSTSYQKHFFNPSRVNLILPMVFDGYTYHIRGEESSIFELSFGSKFYSAYSRFRSFIGIGGGMLFIQQGKVMIYAVDSTGRQTPGSLYDHTGKSYLSAQLNLDVGAEVRIINNLKLIFEAGMVSGIKGPLYFPLTAGIKFGLN